MSFVGVLLMWSAMQHPEATAAARAQQPTGYAHAWGTRFGTVFNDEGRGITVTNDGSVIWTGTTLDFPNTSEEQVPMTVVQRRCGGVSPAWSLAFVVEGVGPNSVVSRALALADRTVEAPSDGLAYVVGRFTGQVDFGVANGPSGVAQPTAYVAKIRESGIACATGIGQTAWVADFRWDSAGDGGTSAALAVAAGRRKRSCAIPQEDVSDAVFGRIAVGGYFKGRTSFHPDPIADEDAYVAILDPMGGAVLRSFTIGGPGNQRITALTIDERTQDVFVAGWYDDINTNFNPDPDPNAPKVHSSNYQSEDHERDMFVARVRVRNGFEPELVTLWTHGSPMGGPVVYDDEATCIALGVSDDATLSTLAFVGGWTTGAGTGRDLYAAAIRADGSLKWFFNPAASGDDRVLAVATDGLGRPVVTGQFGCPYVPNTACEDPSIQFGSALLSPSGLDAFVARFHPINASVDWAYKIGGNFDESATAIAFDPTTTDRFAITGWFGRPDAAPGQYSINPDPAGVTPPVTSAGFADAFLSVHQPAAPQNVGFQISLVLDNSCSMDDNSQQPLPFEAMMLMIRSVLTDPVNIAIPRVGDPRPGGGTRQDAVQLNAIFHSVVVPGATSARVVMPWTEIKADTAALFARRLAATPAYVSQDTGSSVGAGFILALEQRLRSLVPGSASSSLLLLGNSVVDMSVREAGAGVIGPDAFDRICAIGTQTVTRDNLLLYAVAPAPLGATEAAAIDRFSIGIAAEAANFAQATTWFGLMLQRLSWCPSDYTRDECTSIVSSPPDDQVSFELAYGAPFPPTYADWNMDGQFEADPQGQDAIDWPKFRKGLPTSGHECRTCPPPRP